MQLSLFPYEDNDLLNLILVNLFFIFLIILVKFLFLFLCLGKSKLNSELFDLKLIGILI